MYIHHLAAALRVTREESANIAGRYQVNALIVRMINDSDDGPCKCNTQQTV